MLKSLRKDLDFSFLIDLTWRRILGDLISQTNFHNQEAKLNKVILINKIMIRYFHSSVMIIQIKFI